MIVEISAEAERDLERIGDFIARDNPRRALTFLQELRTKCMSLAGLPNGFPLVPRYEALGIRKRGHGDYLIFYRVDAEKVVIIHILHGAQDYGEILSLL
ncbi:type II toxin-antitoxin system RelE/ParE family toxin [Sphingobium phenoxybenzoativorans]|uniref:Type II toxin-antitoxin system RelE/ParE family toxin n=1 Tax=Sphingobium phenoxybenzoativorans TaxID=1592790 RepID=A0A975K768_9SPHN|nr:type II toxin-antitoxin system RelE/ParE family toxin [Sphingobium phenoxybenzoativorans]QUT06068.1 type II toxin-antitoxin system RelE/ParE family toxin [Sphingobium phenoxybenzoativorans]